MACFILLDEEVAEGACQDALNRVVVHDRSETGESGGVVYEVRGKIEEEVAHVPDCQVHELDRVGWPFQVLDTCVFEGLGVQVADLV